MSRTNLTPTTPNAQSSFEAYSARVDADNKARKGLSKIDRIIARIGEELARERFPHLFMTDAELEAQMCAKLGI